MEIYGQELTLRRRPSWAKESLNDDQERDRRQIYYKRCFDLKFYDAVTPFLRVTSQMLDKSLCLED